MYQPVFGMSVPTSICVSRTCRGVWFVLLNNGERRVCCCTPNVTLMLWEGHVARNRETLNTYRYLLRKPEGKGPLGRPSRKWEGSVQMDLERTGWDV